jgi:hypothetical protein
LLTATTPRSAWQLNLKNTGGVAAIGVFNLTYIRQGNNIRPAPSGLIAALQQDLSSPSNGGDSVGLMGNAVLIPAGTTWSIYQTQQRDSNLAEVGAFFEGPALRS